MVVETFRFGMKLFDGVVFEVVAMVKRVLNFSNACSNEDVGRCAAAEGAVVVILVF